VLFLKRKRKWQFGKCRVIDFTNEHKRTAYPWRNHYSSKPLYSFQSKHTFNFASAAKAKSVGNLLAAQQHSAINY